MAEVLSSRPKHQPVWWSEEDLVYMLKEELDWQLMIEVGDSLLVWMKLENDIPKTIVECSRKSLIKILKSHFGDTLKNVPWNQYKGKFWLERFMESPHMQNKNSSQEKWVKKHNKGFSNVYSKRMKLFTGDFGVLMRKTNGTMQFFNSSWVTDGVRLDWASKGLAENLMIEVIRSLELVSMANVPFSRLQEAQKILQKAHDMAIIYRYRSIPAWLDKVYGNGYFHEIFLTLSEKLTHYNCL
ncbi:expressed protein [Phakopsora pachyrhizi]|uniref:Expressed protein n=1 Tax=Phakopsora pachyrhizi TaxID=170000 RepID=A0AAV0AEB3_PHAPC|nr:expressed protein [Phakopsora pachyrhizi]